MNALDDETELAFDLLISQFIDYKHSDEIVSDLFAKPQGVWIKLSEFSNKFSFLSDFIDGCPAAATLQMAVYWMRTPNADNSCNIIIFFEENRGYSRLAYYNGGR